MKKILFILSTLSVQFGFSQSPEKLIPAEADNVIIINLASLSQKINFNDLGNYTFLQNTIKDQAVSSQAFIKEFFRLPEKAGINTKGKIILFSENHDSVNTFTYLVSIGNSKAFKNRVSEILKSQNNNPKFAKYGKYEILNHNNCLSISFNKNTAVISIWQRPYYYSYNDEKYNEEKNKIIALIDSIRYAKSQTEIIPKNETIPDTIPAKNNEYIDTTTYQNEQIIETVQPETEYYYTDYSNDSLMKQFERKWKTWQKEQEDIFWLRQDAKMSQNQLRIFGLNSSTSMASDEGFNKVYNLGNDFVIWFPLSNYSKKIISLFGKKKSYYSSYDTANAKEKFIKAKPDRLAEMLDNNKFYGIGNFEKGKVAMKFNFEFNEKLKPFVEKMNNGNINPDFFNYIKSDNLMGLACLSINTEAWADLYFEIFRRAIESNNKPNKMFAAGLELTDLLINRDVFFHTFRGDGALAFTGLKSYTKTYNSWEYDSTTFESRTVERTKTQYIPEFVYILTIENKVNLDKIISLINRLEGLKEIGKNIWTINTGKPEVDSNFIIVIKDNLFFITNDQKLAKEQIYGGLASTRVVASAYSSYLSGSSFGFWDASLMFKLMEENNNGNDFGNPAILRKMGEKMNNAFYYSKPINQNISETEVSLEMRNRENSSLLEILNLFDDLNKIK